MEIVSNVNNAANTVNTQENDKNCLVNNNNSDDGEMVDTSISEVEYLLFLNETLKLLTIQRQPLMKEV